MKIIIKFYEHTKNFIKRIFLSVKIYLIATYRVIKKYIISFYKSVYEWCSELLLKIYTTNTLHIILLYEILFLVGRLIAFKEDFPKSLIHQIDLTIISLIGLYMLRHLHKTITDARNIMLGVCPYISEPLNKLNKSRLSPLNMLLPIFPVVSFIKKIINLNYVPISLTGIYAIVMAASAFYISLVCYWQLILSTVAIYKLTRIEYMNLPFTFPNDLFEVPNWIKSLANIYKKTQFSFFTVGILFTAEYIMLMPNNISIIDSNGNLNKNLSFAFWSTWIIIFVFIIIAFPIFWISLKKLFLILAKNLNKKVLEELSQFKNASVNDVTSIWSYYQLVNNTIRFESKLFPKGNLYPLIATSVSFILNLVKLYELLKLPFMGSSV